jgi:4-hydroxy-tetrahydrodipicolinate synthase
MLKGTMTALVTPFLADGSLDEVGLLALVARQVEAGVEVVIPCGTTGESPALSDAEQLRLIELTVQACRGTGTRVFAGTGSNNTPRTIERTLQARDLGADGALVVTPAYNKPTPDGLVAHYRAVTGASAGFPILLYNVPGRTGVNMTAETTLRVAAMPGVVGIKEASGSIVQASEILAGAPHGFAVISGDDPLTLPLLALGGTGVVSVVSNVVPERVKALVDAGLAGDFATARRLHFELLPLARALFLETSPAPCKAALTLLGLPAGDVRLPLVPIGEKTRAAVAEALTAIRESPLPTVSGGGRG